MKAEAQAGNQPDRYSTVAIVLHWAIGLAVIGLLTSGMLFAFAPLPQPVYFQMVQIHKSIGIAVLLLVFIRIAWRLFRKPPPYPDALSPRDRMAAKAGHILLYCLMVIMPLSGWAMVSTSPYGLPTYIFNLFQWPHIPILEGRTELNDIFYNAHEIVGWILLAVVTIHIAAVIKHARFDGVNLMPRMGVRLKSFDKGQSS